MGNDVIANRQHLRMESEILNILNHTMKYEIYDENVKWASFTYVKLTKDKSIVNIFVDCFDRSKIDKLVDKMNSSKGVFRTALSKNMNLRRVPQLVFVKDAAIDRNLVIEKAFKEIK